MATSGSDMGQMAPMVEQVEQRLGRCPRQWLVDGGFLAHEQIDTVADKTEVLAPVPAPRQSKDKQDHAVEPDPHAAKPGDTEAVAAWRQRISGASLDRADGPRRPYHRGP